MIMFVADCLSVNGHNHLTIGGVDAIELAEQSGTPLYVMDEGQIRTNCRMFRHSIEKHYSGKGLVTYASKAFSCKEMCRIVSDEGLGLDVVSAGEIYTAVEAGFPAERMFFHGNNKTAEEIAYALEVGVGRLVVDNLTELDVLNRMAHAAGKVVKILFRIKPGVDAHTHSFVRTGQIDSKFGLALETGEAMEAVKEAAKLENVSLVGLHCHIGSQIFDIEPFEHAAEVMLRFISDIKKETGIRIKELDLGGGFGIKYVPENDPVPYDSYMEKVSEVVKGTCAKHGIDLPFLIIEPGRSIVGPAGITLYKVGSIKDIPNIRTYVAIDGGMTDNPRYALYESEYELVVASRAGDARTRSVTLAGKCCESGDLIGKDMSTQEILEGDIVAVLATGAYNYSMASNYNRIPRPAVVMVKDGTSRIVVKRESFEDLVRNDI